jgi:hypothetical protein
VASILKINVIHVYIFILGWQICSDAIVIPKEHGTLKRAAESFHCGMVL